MSAFFIVHRQSITDPDRLKDYKNGVDETIRRFGGKVVVRADGFQVLEGDWHPGEKGDDTEPGRVTIVEFPDMAALQSWYDSPDYAPLKEIRRSATICDAVAVDSGRSS
jgi:uncharacterized protein (DUF1330 family)